LTRSQMALLLVAAAPPAFIVPSTFTFHAVRTNIKMQEAAAIEAPEEPPAPVPPPFNAKTFAATLPGVSAPLGFFDPAGFIGDDMTEGKVRFYQEVEIKHARLAMLASVGFLVGESFHPLWGGNVDVPSYIAFQETPLQTFWPLVVLGISVSEVFSVFTFQNPAGNEPWSIRLDHAAGDLGFDPLGLKPTDAAALKEMQSKELNNGRLAMIGIAGMVMQELVTGSKLF